MQMFSYKTNKCEFLQMRLAELKEISGDSDMRRYLKIWKGDHDTSNGNQWAEWTYKFIINF